MNKHKNNIDQVGADSVGRAARNGMVWTGFQVGGRNLLSIMATAVLARLLTPNDYGLIGMVATLTAFLQVFSEMGLSWATIQKRTLSYPQVINLWWVNAAIGSFLWIICFFVAPHIAIFFNQPELTAITKIMGASFLLAGVGVQPLAVMTRQMRFKEITVIDLASLTSGLVAGIYLAFWGYGYWALVLQALVYQSTKSILLLYRSQFLFQLPTRGVGTLALISFGGLFAVNGLMIYIARSLDSVLIARWWGAEDLGYYSRAYFLMLLPSTIAAGALTSLMVPSLSALKHDRDRFGSAYRRSVTLVAFVACPMSVGLALTAADTVTLIYGERWLPVVPILIWLSLAGVTQPIYNTNGWLFTAVGRPKPYLWLTIVNAIILAIAFVISVRFGVTALAGTYGVVMGLLITWPALWWAHRVAQINFRETVNSLLPVLYCVLLMIFTVSAVSQFTEFLSLRAAFSLPIKVLFGVTSYLVAAKFFMDPQLLREIVRMGSQIAKR